MKKLRELIRLKYLAKLTNRQIGIALGVSPSTISYYLRAIDSAGLTWPISDDIDNKKLANIIEPHCSQLKKSRKFREKPCWEEIHKEMSHKHMTVQLLHQEYVAQNSVSHYSYSNFCREYKIWRKKQKISMHITHEYGDKCFIDYAGDTILIYSKGNKPAIKAQIFIAVLGASNYTFVTATSSQKIPAWIAANVKALEFFGGVPSLLVPDNLKSAIKDSCKYDPVSNPAYAEMAQHYNTAILPARAYKPKDKASVENTVLIVERWIMARLRKHKFYSLAALNNAISVLLTALNNKSFQKKTGSRTSAFKEHEQKSLRPLPEHRYECATFKTVTVQRDYHVVVDKHFYSVPYNLIGLEVECRITNNIIEIIHDHQRVASHVINKNSGEYTTLDEHMPNNHLQHKHWTENLFLEWAKKIGPGTFNVSKEIINSSNHKDRSYRFHLGLKKLAKQYSDNRLESACLRALAIGGYEYKSISSILSKKLDLQPCLEAINTNTSNIKNHGNIRGKDYFKQQLLEVIE
jgi:transposase